MGGRVICAEHLVTSLSNDGIIPDDNSTERTALIAAHALQSQFDGFVHKLLV
jgi:hypothetical protein